MYTREEAKRLKEQFWTSFGQFMALNLSEEGTKANWVNYKTGIKHIFFRMQADNKSAAIYIEIAHPDAGIRELIYAQFQEYKKILEDSLNEAWEWDAEYYDEYGKETARIGINLPQKVSIFKQEDWPTLIQFFKPRILALDSFWTDAKYAFDLFR